MVIEDVFYFQKLNWSFNGTAAHDKPLKGTQGIITIYI